MRPGPAMRADIDERAPTREEIEEQATHVMAAVAALLTGLEFFLAQVKDCAVAREVAAAVHASACDELRRFMRATKA